MKAVSVAAFLPAQIIIIIIIELDPTIASAFSSHLRAKKNSIKSCIITINYLLDNQLMKNFPPLLQS